MPSGKVTWLCPEHQKVSRVTILTNDVVLPGGHSAAEVNKENHMTEFLQAKEMVTTYEKNLRMWPDLGPINDEADVLGTDGYSDCVYVLLG